MDHGAMHRAFPGAGDPRRPADIDSLDAHVASLPSGVVAHETIARAEPPAGSSPNPVPQPPEYVVPVAGPDAEVLRGVPEHTGKRPPSYPPHPLRSPSVRDGDAFAAFSPDILLDGMTVGRLTVRAASVRGDSHNWEGSCRQDAMTVTRIGPPHAEMLLLAIADGVGSATYSHIGSYYATRWTALHLDREAESIYAALRAQDGAELRAIANKAVANAVGELRNGWEGTPRREGRPYADEDYATTLHVLLVPTDARIRERVVFSVGDGGLFVFRNGTWDHGNAAGDGVLDTRTEALPHAYRSVKAALLRSAPGEVLLLGTDGMTNPLTQKDPEFAQRLADAWGGRKAPSTADFLWQTQTRAKSYDDDRTVICLWEDAE